MQKIIAAILVGVLLTGSLVAVKSAYASTAGNQPSEHLYKEKKINSSFSYEYTKNKVIKQKAYGWSFSKVCGLELCPNAHHDTPSKSFLSGKGGMGGMSKTTVNGKYYIKGDYQTQNATKSATKSK